MDPKPDSYLVVHTPSDWEYRAAQEVLFGLGARWAGGEKIQETGVETYGPGTCIFYEIDDHRLTFGSKHWAESNYSDEPIFDLEGLISLVRKGEIERTVRIGDYEVTDVTKTGFNVGCTRVDWKTVEKVLKLRPKEN